MRRGSTMLALALAASAMSSPGGHITVEPSRGRDFRPVPDLFTRPRKPKLSKAERRLARNQRRRIGKAGRR